MIQSLNHSIIDVVYSRGDNYGGNMTASVKTQTITPAMAEKWLRERNDKNRKISVPRAQQIARDIENGLWQFTGDPIRFNGDGKLVDGQHRLRAIVESGISVRSVVIRGLDSDAKFVIDTGKKRGLNDQLRFMDVPYASKVAALTRWLMLYEDGNLIDKQSYRYPTVQEYLAFVEQHQSELIASIRHIHTAAGQFPFHATKVPLQAIRFYTRKTLPGQADTFAAQLFSGAGLDPDSPVLALRKFLENAYIREARYRNGAEIHACVVRAWNHYITGVPLKGALRFRAGGSDREEFPQIVTEV